MYSSEASHTKGCVLGKAPGKCLQNRFVDVDIQLWWEWFVHSCSSKCIKENSNLQWLNSLLPMSCGIPSQIMDAMEVVGHDKSVKVFQRLLL